MMRYVRYAVLLFMMIMGFTFACLNATQITFNYYVATATLPLSMLFAITLIGGILIGVIFCLGWIFTLKKRVYHYRQTLKQYKKFSTEVSHLRDEQPID